jgi:capsular exopolysaccharide synthesis family protein
MSRVDEALRRAALDPTSLHSAGGRTSVDVPIDESALDRYSTERPSTEKPDKSSAKSAFATERMPPIPAKSRSSAEPARRNRVDAFHASLEGKLVVSRETSSVSVEQYRRLAATLLAVQAERGLKTLLVSSSVPGEGKTLTVTNLALTLSESYGRRVLLIDADLRRPSVHTSFGLANAIGLGDALRSDHPQLNPIQLSPTLSVLPAGPADRSPMAELSSDRMRSLVAESASRFDWVLLDSPPIGLLSDAQLVSRICDGVLFVIGAGSTPFSLVQRSIAEIGADRIVGTVLNRVDMDALMVHDYYGHHYAPK